MMFNERNFRTDNSLTLYQAVEQESSSIDSVVMFEWANGEMPGFSLDDAMI